MHTTHCPMTEQDPINRHEGRNLFGLNPAGYDAVRPAYPEWVYTALRERGVLMARTPTLEIGAGTGLATRRLLEYGADPLTIVEPDVRFEPVLDSILQASSATGQLCVESFEDVALPAARFDLIVAATSFHWIDPDTGLHKCKRLLSDRGVVALIWNVFGDLDKPDPFHDATTTLLGGLAVSPSGAPGQLPYALDREARFADARAAGFTSTDYLESRWSLELSTIQVGQLYEGFSHIQRLAPEDRTVLLQKLMQVADDQFGGSVIRNMTTCLYLYRAQST